MFKITTAVVAANPGSSGWVQVHDFAPQDKLKQEKRGRLIAIFALRNALGDFEPQKNASFIKEVLTRLHEEYYGETKRDAASAIRVSVERVAEEFSEGEEVLEISAGVVLGEFLFVSSSNGAGAYLFRNGQLAALTKTIPSKTWAASGRMLNGDRVILYTSLFETSFPPSLIREVFGNVEQFAPKIHEISNAGSLGAVSIFAGEFNAQKVSPGAKEEEHKRNFARRIKDGLIALTENLILFLESIKKPFEKILPQRHLVVGQDTRQLGDNTGAKNKRTAVSVGFILIILLVVSIVFGVRQSKMRNTKKEISQKLEEITHDFNEAKSLSGLNTARSRELIMSAKTKAESLKDSGTKSQELDDLLAAITSSLGSIGGIYEETPSLFLDLGLLSSGFEGSELALSDERMLVLDANSSKLVSIEVQTKKTQILAGPDDIGGAKRTAVYAKRNFVVSDLEILEIDSKGVGLIKKKDWEGDVLFSAYTGNLYLLEKDTSEVYRYQSLGGNEFEDKDKWFSLDTKADLSDAVAWGIDGAVWVLKKGGIIRKFTLGKPDPFSVKGLDKPMTQASDMYVDSDTKYIYILDPENERVIVIDKEGEFKAEYINSEIKNAKRIAVSEKEKKILLLTGSKLQEIEIKHL